MKGIWPVKNVELRDGDIKQDQHGCVRNIIYGKLKKKSMRWDEDVDVWERNSTSVWKRNAYLQAVPNKEKEKIKTKKQTNEVVR